LLLFSSSSLSRFGVMNPNVFWKEKKNPKIPFRRITATAFGYEPKEANAENAMTNAKKEQRKKLRTKTKRDVPFTLTTKQSIRAKHPPTRLEIVK